MPTTHKIILQHTRRRKPIRGHSTATQITARYRLSTRLLIRQNSIKNIYSVSTRLSAFHLQTRRIINILGVIQNQTQTPITGPIRKKIRQQQQILRIDIIHPIHIQKNRTRRNNLRTVSPCAHTRHRNARTLHHTRRTRKRIITRNKTAHTHIVITR